MNKFGGLQIINGQFVKDGKVVKPEIGNTEQIALLKFLEKQSEEREKAAIGGTLRFDDVNIHNVRYSVDVKFTCICSNAIELSTMAFAIDFDDIDEDGYPGREVLKCEKCGRKYLISGSTIKLI